MSENDGMVRAREIHLTGNEGNVRATIKVDFTEDNDPWIVVSDDKNRIRLRLVIRDKDPGTHSHATILEILDETGREIWDMQEPCIAS